MTSKQNKSLLGIEWYCLAYAYISKLHVIYYFISTRDLEKRIDKLSSSLWGIKVEYLSRYGWRLEWHALNRETP